MKKETVFENDLKYYASLFNCAYIKIPDFIPLKRYGQITAHRRPFDGILITKTKNICIECKIDTNKLKFHQQQIQDYINKINQSYYILRKKFLKKGILYRIEQPEKIILMQSDKIEDIYKYFDEKL